MNMIYRYEYLYQNMTDFRSLDASAHLTTHPSIKISIYQDIVRRAQLDPIFLTTINMPIFWESTRIFSYLLPPHTVSSKSLNIAILGYTSNLVPPWDPFDCVKGLPGSEECAVYASKELVNKGHNVTLYMNPPKDSIWRSPFSNPRWLHVETWDIEENKNKYDLVLMWRRYDVEAGRKRGKFIFFWPHDSPWEDLRNKQFPKFDGVLSLSKHHSKQLSIMKGFDQIPQIISGNGIIGEQFKRPMRFTNQYSVGYYSNYSRGLMILLKIWPSIIDEFSDATLDICYGRETWNTISKEGMDWIINKIEEYKILGVTERGKVGHKELAEIMETTSILAYPCNTESETFCITVVKCQAAGCIPVTTRIGALDETVHPEAPSMGTINTNEDVDKYKEILLNTMRKIRKGNKEEIKREREKYIEYAKKFYWEEWGDKCIKLYKSVVH